jgi:hypothetical protein
VFCGWWVALVAAHHRGAAGVGLKAAAAAATVLEISWLSHTAFVVLLSSVVDAMDENANGIRFYIGHELVPVTF